MANGTASVAARLLGWSAQKQLLRLLRRGIRKSLSPRIVSKLRNLLRRRQHAGAPAIAAPTDPLRAAVSRANTLAINGYVPRYYDGRVECMWAEAEPFETRTWAIAASDVRLTPVAGNHNTCVTTQVASLGGYLARALREAQEMADKRDATPSAPRPPLSFRKTRFGKGASGRTPASHPALGAARTKATLP